MTACTEQHVPAPDNGLAREGQKGMHKGGHSMTAHAWVDATAGVAGDMLLGALVDAGADLDAVRHAVGAVIPGAVRITASPTQRAGLRALKLNVEVLVADPPRRTWQHIRTLLAGSGLPDSVRDRALAVFARLAAAEAHVHGIAADDVHFHEVGALDSIADVVGVCAALEDLGVTTVSASEVALGAGRITVAHGEIPIPGPAVTRLAEGWRVRSGGRGELATPTGMALLVTLSAECADLPSMTVDRVGVGAGTRDTPGRPNVVRVIIGAPAPAVPDPGEPAVLLEANVDDLDPRLWPGVLARLLEHGAADAWLVPIVMKKGRPAHTLSVLCRPDQVGALRDIIFAETSTIGVRAADRHKYALPRLYQDVNVDGGKVTIKVAHRDGVIVQAMPEFDQVAALAARQSRPPRVVLAAALAAAANAGLVVGAPLPEAGR